ncbi:MAG TPA: hypothetical protein RMH85_07150 [Polyangiaceae bacterium LLY-WYZ-15_(1-7)]|nr:hypothetical protein [Sandaracinus sp.]HJL05228.1 hypothetical protein [Polyangiaceae bacterium LLY-WYZ-15_(1-7)]HJL08255.1 hypothetical protein [Polyangiaceae bacterium LLY-WYZ-15_(1-7)]
MAEDAHEEFPEHPGYAEATALYRAARAAGRDRRDAYRDAAERAASEHGPRSAPYAASLYYLATHLDEEGASRDATGLWHQLYSVECERFGPRHSETAGTLNNLGLHHERLGETDEMEVFLRWSIAVSRFVGEPTLRAEGNLGKVLAGYRDDRRALAVMERAAREGAAEARGEVLHSRAVCFARVGEAQAARGAFEEAIRLLDEAGSARQLCNALHNRALFLQRHLGASEEVRQAFEEAAAEERARFGVSRSLYVTERERVRFLLRAERWAEAEERARAALELPAVDGSEWHREQLERLLRGAARRDEAARPAPPEPIAPPDPAVAQLEVIWAALSGSPEVRLGTAERLFERAALVGPAARRLYAERWVEAAVEVGEGERARPLLGDEDAVVAAIVATRLEAWDWLEAWHERLLHRRFPLR